MCCRPDEEVPHHYHIPTVGDSEGFSIIRGPLYFCLSSCVAAGLVSLIV